jgi:hypothetical protein
MRNLELSSRVTKQLYHFGIAVSQSIKKKRFWPLKYQPPAHDTYIVHTHTTLVITIINGLSSKKTTLITLFTLNFSISEEDVCVCVGGEKGVNYRGGADFTKINTAISTAFHHASFAQCAATTFASISFIRDLKVIQTMVACTVLYRYTYIVQQSDMIHLGFNNGQARMYL